MQQDAIKELVLFLHEYLALIVEHLTAVEKCLNDSVGNLRNSANVAISRAQKGRKHAEDMMISAHLNPDDNTSQEIDLAQAAVDQIMEESRNSVDTTEGDEAAHLRRQGGKFSKSVEALALLEEKLSKIFLELLDSLSKDQEIGQRINVTRTEMRKLTSTLNSLLVAYTSRFNGPGILSFKKGVLDYTYLLCKSDRSTFEDCFGKDYKADLKKPFEGPVAEDLFQFIEAYGGFLTAQLQSTQTMIRSTVDAAMDAVEKASQSTELSKAHADAAYVKSEDQQGEDFKLGSIKEIEQEEGSQGHRKSKLAMPNRLLEKMDSVLGKQMLAMMGSLSFDDVICQRMEHICQIITALNPMATLLGQQPSVEDVRKIKDQILSAALSSYTMEEEKQEFKKVFTTHQAA